MKTGNFPLNFKPWGHISRVLKYSHCKKKIAQSAQHAIFFSAKHNLRKFSMTKYFAHITQCLQDGIIGVYLSVRTYHIFSLLH